MIAQLTGTERKIALALAILLAFFGLAMAGAAQHVSMAGHGYMAIGLGVAHCFAVVGGIFEPEPAPERLSRYLDDPIKVGILLSMVRGPTAIGGGALGCRFDGLAGRDVWRHEAGRRTRYDRA